MPPGTLDVWYVDLAGLADDSSIAAVLDAQERARAERFRVAAATTRYVATRGAVRHILSGYVGRGPQTLRFGYGPAGKPYLDPPVSGLGFNLSHSAEVALCAVLAGGEVGVDVEAVRPARALDRIVERHFCATERAQWHALAEEDRLAGFYRIWTRKEAVLKAAGVGLTRPLERVDSSTGVLDGESYWLEDIRIEADIVGAVAATGTPMRVRRWRFQGTGPR